MKQQKKIALFGSLRALVLCAVLVAISIVCGKFLAIPGGNVLRFSFENLPILLAGFAYGPFVGATVGIVADLLGSILRGYDINLILSIGAAAIGLLGGICFRYSPIRKESFRVAFAVTIAHIAGSVIIKTVGLSVHYTMPLHELMLWRLLNYAIVGVLEGVLLCILIRNTTLRRYLSIR